MQADDTAFKNQVRFIWNDKKNTFRSHLMSKFSYINCLTSNTDIRYRTYINDVINNFSGAKHEVADPLFSKYCSYKSNPYFNDQSVLNQADWFDI